MRLSDACYLVRDGYPLLGVVIDDRPAELGSETKPTLHAAGLVFLGSGFEDLVPPIDFKPPDGEWTELRGFASDRRLFRLYDDFLGACNSDDYAVGAVAIPD